MPPFHSVKNVSPESTSPKDIAISPWLFSLFYFWFPYRGLDPFLGHLVVGLKRFAAGPPALLITHLVETHSSSQSWLTHFWNYIPNTTIDSVRNENSTWEKLTITKSGEFWCPTLQTKNCTRGNVQQVTTCLLCTRACQFKKFWIKKSRKEVRPVYISMLLSSCWNEKDLKREPQNSH